MPPIVLHFDIRYDACLGACLSIADSPFYPQRDCLGSLIVTVFFLLPFAPNPVNQSRFVLPGPPLAGGFKSLFFPFSKFCLSIEQVLY